MSSVASAGRDPLKGFPEGNVPSQAGPGGDSHTHTTRCCQVSAPRLMAEEPPVMDRPGQAPGRLQSRVLSCWRGVRHAQSS